MIESITFHLHAEKATVVTFSHSEGTADCQPYTTLEIGPVTIFATVDLLRRIAEEATKAALVAEGWSVPSAAEAPLSIPSAEIPF
jgi:hypothetical protein